MLINFVLCVLAATAYGQYLSTIPALIPLIHKTPYVNAWIATGGNISTLVGHWPQLYNGRSLGWMIAARVDGTGYVLQGVHANYTASNAVAAFITPTRTIIMMDAGPVRLNLTYLTPIELDDWTRHSLPLGYFCIDLWSTDGKAHSVQLYSDVSGEFISSYPQDLKALNWNTTVNSTLIYHEAYLSEMSIFSSNETDDSRRGTQFFAFRTTPRVAATWQSCYSESCRNIFSEVGKLGNISDTITINNSSRVMAVALDLGNITQSGSPLVFAIGLFFNTTLWYSRGSEINGFGDESPTSQISLWWRRWSNIWDAIDSSLLKFPYTLSRAAELDTKIGSDTSKLDLPTSVIANLTNLVIMSVRQTIGSLDITTNRTDQGPLELNDVRVFMRDIGNSDRANPVEVIYASFPAFLYLNSSLAGRLLEPLLETNVTTGTYHSEYSKLDLGGWPLVNGNYNDSTSTAIESSGSMLILALAYTQKSGDRSLISRYYNLLHMWADYLVKNSLNMAGSITADGSTATSNLALKEVTGIYAMGKINQFLEGKVSGADANRTSYYLSTAQKYAERWHNLTWSTGNYTMSTFGSIWTNDNYTWGLLYNLYTLRLIGADKLISDEVYKSQASVHYSSLKEFPTDLLRYESPESEFKMHWILFGAGSISQDMTGTRDALIANAHFFSFTSGASYYPNPSTHRSQSGRGVYSGNASAANGAAFVFHALSLPIVTPHVAPPVAPTPKFGYKLGIILAALVIIIVMVGIFFYRRRLGRQSRMTPYLGEPVTTTPQPSKHHVSGPVAQQPGPTVFLATDDRFDSHACAKSSTLRRAEVVHAPNEPSSSNANPETGVDDTQEEDIRRRVEQLTVELNEALRIQEDGIPPPYTE